MYTEEEAKGKWCPMTSAIKRYRYFRKRVTELIFLKPNLSSGLGFNKCMFCIGSGCMFWRWDEYNTIYLAYDEQPIPEGYKKRADGHFERINPLGYCGKGGNP